MMDVKKFFSKLKVQKWRLAILNQYHSFLFFLYCVFYNQVLNFSTKVIRILTHPRQTQQYLECMASFRLYDNLALIPARLELYKASVIEFQKF